MTVGTLSRLYDVQKTYKQIVFQIKNKNSKWFLTFYKEKRATKERDLYQVDKNLLSEHKTY